MLTNNLVAHDTTKRIVAGKFPMFINLERILFMAPVLRCICGTAIAVKLRCRCAYFST